MKNFITLLMGCLMVSFFGFVFVGEAYTNETTTDVFVTESSVPLSGAAVSASCGTEMYSLASSDKPGHYEVNVKITSSEGVSCKFSVSLTGYHVVVDPTGGNEILIRDAGTKEIGEFKLAKDPVTPPPPTGCTSNCGGGGGGGGPTIFLLTITNEHLEMGTSSTATITFDTNLPSDGRVTYGTNSFGCLSSTNSNYGYSRSTVTVGEMSKSHSFTITGLTPGIKYYFCPISNAPNTSGAMGTEMSGIIKVPEVVVPAPVPVKLQEACLYLKKFLKYGDPGNDWSEVIKLKVFLKEFEGAQLDVDGFFDLRTRTAVDIFQKKYQFDILDQWGYKDPTGYVYLTTRKKVNEIYCRGVEFPLDQNQTAEVRAFHALMESLKKHGVIVSVKKNVNKTTESKSTTTREKVEETISAGVHKTKELFGLSATPLNSGATPGTLTSKTATDTVVWKYLTILLSSILIICLILFLVGRSRQNKRR